MKNVKNESFIIIKKQYVEENSNVIKFFFLDYRCLLNILDK